MSLPCPSLGFTVALRIKQECELVSKFGGWLRSNNRGTDATLTLTGSRAVLVRCREALLGKSMSDIATLRLRLCYEDTSDDVQMIARHQHPDKVSAIPVRGGHKAAIPITSSSRIEMSSATSSTLPTQQFSSVGEVQPKENGLCSLMIATKFSTNITSTNHGSRTMFWRAEFELSASGNAPIVGQSDSPAFAYHPREPKIGESARINLVLCDGRPGDLLILHGERLGSVHKDLQCRLSVHSEQGEEHVVVLQRAVLQSTQSLCFTTRIPADIPAGAASVCMIINDAVVSNEQPLKILHSQAKPALPLHALPTNSQPTTAAETSGPVSNKTQLQQSRQSRRDRPYMLKHSVRKEQSSLPTAPRQEISLILAPPASQWQCPTNCTGLGFDYSPQSRLPLSRQSSEGLSLLLSSIPMSRSNSQDFTSGCRASDVLSLSRTISEELMAFGVVS